MGHLIDGGGDRGQKRSIERGTSVRLNGSRGSVLRGYGRPAVVFVLP
jgi:hypothetical protein